MVCELQQGDPLWLRIYGLYVNRSASASPRWPAVLACPSARSWSTKLGTRSIDPRHLSRLAKALYVEESEIRMRCDPRPGVGQLERQATNPEGYAAPPPRSPVTTGPPSQGGPQPPPGQPRARTTRPPRPASEAKPPAPARASQLAHINDLLQRLGKDRESVEAELGKPLDQLDRLQASQLLVRLQADVKLTPTPDRHRAYLPEAVDSYEMHYLTRGTG